MKALVLDKAYSYQIKEVNTPILQEDEILIEIKASGICTNDIRDYLGNSNYTLPRIGGHEYSGTIIKRGAKVDSQRFKDHANVVVYIIPACGECYHCKQKQENLCENVQTSKTFQNKDGMSGFGGFAQYIAVKSKDVYVFQEETPFEIMAMSEPLACVVSSVHKCNIRFGDDVVILGGGYMGMLHLMCAILKGARVILSEPNEERRKLALQHGCSHVFDPTQVDATSEVRRLTHGRGANVVFDTTSLASVAKQAIEMTGAGGCCMLFSSIHPNTPIELDAGRIHSKEIQILGSVSPTIDSFHQAVLLLEKRIIDPTFLLHKVLPYSEVEDAFIEALKPDTFKVMLTFNNDTCTI